MRRPRQLISKLLLIVLLVGTTFAAFWLGLVPQRYSPFAPVNLSEPSSWFLDFRLAALKSSRDVCIAALTTPVIEAAAVPDQPFQKGCGWKNAVRVASAGGAKLSIDVLTCEAAAATAMWLQHVVQPAARLYLGSPVAGIQHFGGYSCRNIVGNKIWKEFRSQHAIANAIDIAGFQLEDGRTISVRRDWPGKGAEATFLRDIHAGACPYFRVALGPAFNPAHGDHFHFDRGPLRTCK